MIKFGPAGLGGIKEAIGNLETYHKLGLKACEIAFTYSIYIKRKEDAEEIRNAAGKLGIELSIHAPYWINLNSSDNEKMKKSKERIVRCCEVGTWLNARRIVFHPGYYGKTEREESYENIKNAIIDIMEESRKKGYTPKLAPETSGKANVFGSIEDISRLVKETHCSFCIDFAHILARYKEYKFKEVIKEFKEHESWHIHFSGIEYDEKGERRHKNTSEEELKKLLSSLPKDIKMTIINESPNSVEDSVLALSLYTNK